MVIVELNTMNKYAIAIFYSDEDEGYIAVVPELPNYCPTNTNIFIRNQKMGSFFIHCTSFIEVKECSASYDWTENSGV
jgi:hypothetical protein